MILDNKDIKFCKSLINKIAFNAVLDNDRDIIEFTAMLMEMLDFYESHMNSWEYTAHHNRQATSFIKRLAIANGKYKCIPPKDFVENFIFLINDYPAIKQRYKEWVKGVNK